MFGIREDMRQETGQLLGKGNIVLYDRNLIKVLKIGWNIKIRKTILKYSIWSEFEKSYAWCDSGLLYYTEVEIFRNHWVRENQEPPISEVLCQGKPWK